MNVLSRNKPIFILGLILALIFSAIIIFSQDRDAGISLIDRGEEIMDSRPQDVVISPSSANESNIYFPPPEVTEEQDSTAVGIVRETPIEALEIVFAEESGFTPNYSNVYQGQPVRWINSTDRGIFIRELISKHQELASGVLINPGESFELIMYGEKLWSFEEVQSGQVGRLFIAKP